jgi:hypothetical protein
MRFPVRRVAMGAAMLASAIAATAHAADVRVLPQDQTALAITIYSNDLGLVIDRRTTTVAPGRNRLGLAGVSRQIIPTSAFVSADRPIDVISVDYQFDLLTPAALLERAVGETVGVIRTHPTTGEETVEQATVLSVQDGVVLRYRDRIETGIPGRLVFATIPQDLHPQPTLSTTIISEAGGPLALELGYLTTGLAWEADYMLEVDEPGERLGIIGRATIRNTSGTEFAGASLALIAGEVRREAMPVPQPRAAMAESRMMLDAAPAVEREAIGDLHLYRIDEPVTLADRQTRQIALLSAANVPLTREYVSVGGPPVFRLMHDDPQPEQAIVRLRFSNDMEAGPGVPLPAGLARVYTRGADGGVRFLGEQQIPHSAVGQQVEVSPGRAFDVTVKREQTDYSQIGAARDVFESAHRLTVANAKDEAVTVRLIEIIAGDWEIVQASAPHEKESADRAVWSVEVPPHEMAEVSYRVRVRR